MNIELKKKKERRNAVIRWIFNYLIMAFCYVFMSTVKTGYPLPLLLIPAAVCVSLREQPFDSALYGCVCGLLLDSAQDTLVGFNAIILMWCCLMTSLLFGYLLRKHIVNFILIDLLITALQSGLHYLFYYMLWGYDRSGRIFGSIFVPELIFTNLSGIIMFIVVGVLARTFGTVTEHYIEEKSDDIVRE
ncbi:MAG: hypothetical protein ACI4JJ_03745 [Huintestinicola sp.]